MDRLISEQAVLKIIDSYIGTDPISTRIKAIPSAEPSDEQIKEYCRRRCLTMITDEFMAHIIADSGKSIRAIPSAEPKIDRIKMAIQEAYCNPQNDYDRGRNYGLHMAIQIMLNAVRGEQDEADN